MFLKLTISVLCLCFLLTLHTDSLVCGVAVEPLCDMMCIDLYAPVCGSDGKTYGNGCYLSIANCGKPAGSRVTLVSQGACGADVLTAI